jgi:hypothetical protein
VACTRWLVSSNKVDTYEYANFIPLSSFEISRKGLVETTLSSQQSREKSVIRFLRYVSVLTSLPA